MKRLGRWLIAVVMAVCPLLQACEKVVLEGETPAVAESSGKIRLEIRVNGFNVIPFDVTRASEQLSKYCSRLNFVVFQNGKKLKGITQQKDEVDFGSVSLDLEPGTYQVLVVGHSSQGNPSLSTPEKVQFTNDNGYTDTFYSYETVSVGDGDSSCDVVLERVTAMFRLIAKDAVPAEVARVRFYYTGGSGALDATTGFGCVNSKQVAFFDISEEMKGKPITLEAYTIPKSQRGTLKVIISAYDANSNVLAEKEVANVPIEQNRITEYTGTLFSSPSDNEEPFSNEDNSGQLPQFTIGINGEWVAAPLQGSF